MNQRLRDLSPERKMGPSPKRKTSETPSPAGSGEEVGGRRRTASRWSAALVAQARALRKTLVPRPTQTSAAVPSKAHLRVLTSRAVCSLYQWYSPADCGCPSSEKAICAGEEEGSGPGTPSVIRCPVSIQCPVVSMPGPIVTGDTPIFVTHPV